MLSGNPFPQLSIYSQSSQPDAGLLLARHLCHLDQLGKQLVGMIRLLQISLTELLLTNLYFLCQFVQAMLAVILQSMMSNIFNVIQRIGSLWGILLKELIKKLELVRFFSMLHLVKQVVDLYNQSHQGLFILVFQDDFASIVYMK